MYSRNKPCNDASNTLPLAVGLEGPQKAVPVKFHLQSKETCQGSGPRRALKDPYK